MKHNIKILYIKYVCLFLVKIFVFCSISFADYVILSGATNNLKMRCSYNYGLEFDLSSAGTDVSNFVDLISEFSTGGIHTISWGNRNTKIDPTISQYKIDNLSSIKNIILNGGFNMPWTKSGQVGTINITFANDPNVYYRIYGINDKKGLKDNVSSIRYGPYQANFTSLIPVPCVEDNGIPDFYDVYPTGITNGGIRISSKSGIKLSVKDINNQINSAGRISDDYSDPKNNYLHHSQLNYISTNQVGINIDTFVMTLSQNNNPIYSYTTKTWDINNIGTSRITTPQDKTWQYLDKNYLIEMVENIDEFGREKEMKIDVSIQDRNGNTRNRTWIFNSPDNPKIKNILPTIGSTIFPLTDVSFIVYDNRAGINPNTIEIQIYNKKDGTQNELLAILSGQDLNLSEVMGIADSPDLKNLIKSGMWYNGGFFTFPMPITSGEGFFEFEFKIKALDYEGNTGVNSYSLYSRNACVTYPGCSEPLKISGIYDNYGNSGEMIYYRHDLRILAGDNINIDNNICNCGVSKTGSIIGTNIIGNGINNQYKSDKIYIQGGTIIKLEDGTLVINPN